jgi:hypothetical protein
MSEMIKRLCHLLSENPDDPELIRAMSKYCDRKTSQLNWVVQIIDYNKIFDNIGETHVQLPYISANCDILSKLTVVRVSSILPSDFIIRSGKKYLRVYNPIRVGEYFQVAMRYISEVITVQNLLISPEMLILESDLPTEGTTNATTGCNSSTDS